MTRAISNFGVTCPHERWHWKTDYFSEVSQRLPNASYVDGALYAFVGKHFPKVIVHQFKQAGGLISSQIKQF